jgi:thiol:disulfide interchange protein DsbD
MKTARLLVFSLSLLLAIQLLSSCAKETEEASEGVKWLASLEEAVEVAKKKDQPIMVDFYADWCGWCKRLHSETYVHEDVVSRAQDFVSLMIDADAERDLSSKYRVAGLPTILFIDHAGREIHRVVGYRSAPSFVTEMDRALEAFRGKAGT